MVHSQYLPSQATPSDTLVKMYSLPGSISKEDARLMSSLNRASLLGQAGLSYGELFTLHKTLRGAEESKFFEPYADLLEEDLAAKLTAGKDTILAAFKKCTHSQLEVPLVSWNTVRWHESLNELQWRRSNMTSDQLAAEQELKWEQEQTILDNGWETKVGVTKRIFECVGYNVFEESTETSLFPAKVDKIFRHSDLAQRIALLFGTNFSTYIKQETVDGAGDAREVGGFSVAKRTLVLRFLPYGPTPSQMKRLLEVARTQNERRDAGKRTLLLHEETLVGADLLRLSTSA